MGILRLWYFTFAAEYTSTDLRLLQLIQKYIWHLLLFFGMPGLTLRYSGGEYDGDDFDRIHYST